MKIKRRQAVKMRRKIEPPKNPKKNYVNKLNTKKKNQK